MAKSNAIVLSSGGLHSLVTAGLAGREFRISMVHLKDGRPAAKQAADAFERQVAHFKPLKNWMVEAGYLRQMALPPEMGGASTTSSDPQASLVPLRELQMLIVAAGFAQQIRATTVMWGVQFDQRATDALARVVEIQQMLNQMLEVMTPENPVVIKTPLMGLEDGQVLELGYQMGLPYHLSWSCQMPTTEAPCMSCPACARRIRAFRAAQLTDPLVMKK
jgi:7-cyano-7-deazaguanine synthase